MQVFKSKCITRDQVFFLTLILVILSYFLCFCVLHLYSTFIRFPKTMAPLQVLKNFKFKLFFSGEPDATSYSLPHVASNVQAASGSIRSFCSSSNCESKRNGKELVEFVEPLEKKLQRPYDYIHVFQDTWACCFPWAEIVVGEDGLVA